MNAEFDYVFQPDLLQRVAVSEFSTTTYTHTRTQSTNKINILKKEGKKKKKKKEYSTAMPNGNFVVVLEAFLFFRGHGRL
jgi:hypothetical protein